MQQFEELKDYLHSNFVELDHAIRALLLGLTAKAHVFLLGPPGTAKSHLAEVICDSLELKSFRFLFTDETKHKDIFGIQSIQALKEDKDVLITEGKLPVAEVAYLDEIWKANASVVNMLLWALRDGKFTNGGQAVKMPLVFAIACSNEIPEDSTRRAIYDRLLIREEVKDIEMGENFRKVLERSDAAPPKVPMKEIEELWKSAEAVKVTDNGCQPRYPPLGHPKIAQEGTGRCSRSETGGRDLRKRRRRDTTDPDNGAVPPRRSFGEELQDPRNHQNARPDEA